MFQLFYVQKSNRYQNDSAVFFFQTKYEATKIPTRKKIIIVRLSIFESATQTDFLTRWNDERAYGKCSSEPLFRFLHSHRRYQRPVLITVHDIDKNALRTNKCIYVCMHILPERIQKKKIGAIESHSWACYLALARTCRCKRYGLERTIVFACTIYVCNSVKLPRACKQRSSCFRVLRIISSRFFFLFFSFDKNDVSLSERLLSMTILLA